MTIRNLFTHQIFAILIILSTLALTLSLTAQERHGFAEPDGTLRRIRIPILMYHYVSELPDDADELRIGLTVTPDVFRQQMQTLVSHGYSTISLYEMDAALRLGHPLPPNPVILTFDDGHIDHYTTVFPILQEMGKTGTFFIITNFADSNAPGYMSWEQIEEMSAAGMYMEPHTKTHSDLRNRSYDFLVYEILGSIESLAFHTANQPSIFSYPAGRYDENTLAVISTAPILRAVTTQPGTWQTTDNALLVPRMRVTNENTGSGFLALLRYDQ